MNKQIVGRVQHKHDTNANWLKATGFIPLEGELIIYDIDEDSPAPRFKVGDGKTLVSDLPFSESVSTLDEDYLSIDLTDAEQGTANLINADSLGGVDAVEYVLKTDVIENAVNAENATNAVNAENAVSAENAVHAVNAQNSDALGGVAADKYVLKTDVIENAENAENAVNSENAVNAQNSEELGGKEPKYYLQPRNLLDNSDFRNPVNQRGAANYTAAGYSIDRWILLGSANSVDVTDGGLVLGVTNGDVGMVDQRIPESVISSTEDVGKQYSFAAKIDGNIYVLNVTVGETATIALPCGTMEFLYSNAGQCYVVRFSVNTTAIVEWAALYEGAYTAENLPPYVAKGYAAELAECQRYFRILKENAILNGYISGSQKSLLCSVPIDGMREDLSVVLNNATVTIRTVSGYSSLANYESPAVPPSIEVYHTGAVGYLQTVWASAIGTNNTPASMQIRSGSIYLTADL